MEIQKSIRDRWSPVIFSEKDIENKKLEVLFEAAKYAPSSYNRQPWRFVVTKRSDTEKFGSLYECLYEGNKEWVKHVPVLVLSLAEIISAKTKEKNKYAFHDTGMAVCNLLIQATSMGLHVHQMGGYDIEKVRSVLNIPEQFEPVAMIAIGYKGNPGLFPKHLQERDSKKSVRNPVSNFVFTTEWGNSYF